MSKTMFEAAVEIAVTLNPPVDTILPLLEQHEQEMVLAKRMATSVTDFMEKTMVLAGSRTDQQIVDWLQCHIPASLLREAADMWDDDDVSNWEWMDER